jgi:hypothetical protein
VRWWLVTSLPIPTTADAERVVRYYALRWLVERYHFVMKSGCRVEQLQLQTAERRSRAEASRANHWHRTGSGCEDITGGWLRLVCLAGVVSAIVPGWAGPRLLDDR